jgi:hypothetical protein
MATIGLLQIFTMSNRCALTKRWHLDIHPLANSSLPKNGKVSNIPSTSALPATMVPRTPSTMTDSSAFQSPTGRAVGIGWVNELIARLTDVQPNATLITNENSTLDDSAATFPLNQTLYMDFTHDTNIMGVITALGLTQFNQFLPITGAPPNQQLIVSHMEPFAARLVLEKIQCSAPVPANRNGTTSGSPTSYIHMLLNQRTVPLGASYPACGNRSDGWCEYNAYLSSLAPLNALANFTYACFGNYSALPYGTITNGAPVE